TVLRAPAHSFYLSPAIARPKEARRNTEIIETTIPVMSDLANNDLQRMALLRLKTRTAALRDGLSKLSDELTDRTDLLHNTIDATKAEATGAVDGLSAKLREREQV